MDDLAKGFYIWWIEANSIAPGKRMLSSMTPSVVEKTENYLWW
jgi:gamma-glutamyltranspeptidase